MKYTREEMDTWLNENLYTFKIPNGKKYGVPIKIIAYSRAKYYAEIDEISFEESLYEDTVPLFMDNFYDIEDWATGNMDYEDVKNDLYIIDEPIVTNYQDAWLNSTHTIMKRV